MGRVGKPHGLNGDVTVLPDTDDPDRFGAGSTFFTDSDRMLVIAGVKPYRDRGLVVLFEGIRSRKAAEALRGLLLTIDVAEHRALDHDEFWSDDLAGLEAVDGDGSVLGTVDRIEFGPGQDWLIVVTRDGREILVPFVSEFVGDPEDGRIVINAPEGLF